MSKPLILADLDDTLFQTRRKMKELSSTGGLRVAAIDSKGVAHSFLTPAQAQFIDWALSATTLIPVTARSAKEFARVSVPFTSWAVLSHGAVVLTPDGEVDSTWEHRMQASLAPYASQLVAYGQAVQTVAQTLGLAVRVRIVREYGDVPVYIAIKHTDSAQCHQLKALEDALVASQDMPGLYVHRNGNNLALIPSPVSKAHGAQYVLEQLAADSRHTPVIGMGDSVSDYPFMRLCTWFAAPAKSQLADTLLPLLASCPQLSHHV